MVGAESFLFNDTSVTTIAIDGIISANFGKDSMTLMFAFGEAFWAIDSGKSSFILDFTVQASIIKGIYQDFATVGLYAVIDVVKHLFNVRERHSHGLIESHFEVRESRNAGRKSV